MSTDFCISLEDCHAAAERIHDHAHITPILSSDNLSFLVGCHVHLKLEVFQRCKSFKFRGALNKLCTLPKGTTVCCCSAGNHSQGVALAASLCNCRSVIFMPEIAPTSKVQATQHYGGDVIQIGSNFDEAKSACMKALEAHPDWVFVPPYNDKHIIAGAGTIALEILSQCPDVDTIVIPVGGGGLLSGVAFVAKTLKPNVRIIGVQMACPYTFKLFYEHRKQQPPPITSKEAVTPLSDGIQVRSPGDLNLNIIYRYVDDVVVVTEDEVAVAVALLAERGKLVAEGAGATPFAAMLAKKFSFGADEKIVGVISGGNIQLSMFARCIDRALFLRNSRIALTVVLPWGTQHLVALIEIFAGYHVQVISCVSVPHVDTVANREKYTIIVDVASQDVLDAIKQDCVERGWPFRRETTNVKEE